MYANCSGEFYISTFGDFSLSSNNREMKPASAMIRSISLNSSSSTPASVGATRKSQSVFASKTVSLGSRPQKVQPGQPVAHHLLRRLQRQTVEAPQNQHHLKFQNRVQLRAVALRTGRVPGGLLENRPEPIEIHWRRPLLQRIPYGLRSLQGDCQRPIGSSVSTSRPPTLPILGNHPFT